MLLVEEFPYPPLLLGDGGFQSLYDLLPKYSVPLSSKFRGGDEGRGCRGEVLLRGERSVPKNNRRPCCRETPKPCRGRRTG